MNWPIDLDPDVDGSLLVMEPTTVHRTCPFGHTRDECDCKLKRRYWGDPDEEQEDRCWRSTMAPSLR